MNDSKKIDFDVIIVGGGSAGCVMANRLSEDGGRSVLLLEAGPTHKPNDYPADLTGIGRFSAEPQYTWGYQSSGVKPAHSLAAYAGKILGGTSAINGGISRRALPVDFARWQKHGLPDWSWENALATYKKLENTSDGEDEWHGRSGPWPIRQTPLADLSPSVRAYVDTAAANGFARVVDFNGANPEGVGPEVKNVENGIRLNAGMTYLSSEVRARPNLTIRADAAVDRVGFEGKSATTVYLVGGESLRAKEIVLTAGVYGTPAILMRSGIGPADDLKKHGIEVVADLPVGQHLQDQPMFTLLFAINPEIPTTPADTNASLWTRSSAAKKGDLDIQLSISVMPSYDPPGQEIGLLRIWTAVVVPRSSGTVTLKSNDPRITPAIEYNLLSDVDDRRRLIEVIKLARGLAKKSPVADLIEQEVHPGPQVVTDEQLNAAIDASLTTYYHGCGTAPMGGDNDPAAVIDSDGRVKQVQGLVVADASAFPESVSPPSNLTTLMVAERIAEKMLAVGKRGVLSTVAAAFA